MEDFKMKKLKSAKIHKIHVSITTVLKKSKTCTNSHLPPSTTAFNMNLLLH